ncbi:hypothetical protein D3C87_114330 [compost metagenome]|uniref:hypothetical protein n=1 Tax=Sphingobacterium sp. WOUb80 TaxID=3234028 RepID=UPI000FBCDAE3
MKFTIKTIFLLCIALLFSCQQKNEAKKTAIAVSTSTSIDTLQKKEAMKSTSNDDLALFNQLYPIDILQPESKNSFKKYGIEFSGICYACDLAEIKINKKQLHLVNVCDSNEIYQIKDFTYNVRDSSLTIKTKNNEFSFKKIEKEPIFELQIKGDSLLLKNKRIAKYYTQKSLIDQFEVHDCGDFQG